jgi:hypothetical protein
MTKEKKWVFNWRFGLLILGFVTLINSSNLSIWSLIGALTGAVIVSILTGFDPKLRIK